jgi:hypothetical protein
MLSGMRKALLTGLAFSLCGFSPQTEDVSGWAFVRSLPIGAKIHGVGTAHAPLPVRDGDTSIRFEVRPGDCSAGRHGWDDCERDRERSELKQIGYQFAGETWWFGFSMYVPEPHRNIWPAKLSFAQFHQEGARPAIMLQNHRGGLWLDIHGAEKTIRLIPLIAADGFAGRWHDVKLHIRWSAKEDGFIRAYVGTDKVADYRGATMSAQKVYFKFGLYRSHPSRNAETANTVHSVYFDKVMRARSRSGLR